MEELRASLETTTYLHQRVERYSIVVASFTILLRNKAFLSKRTSKLPIEG